MNAKDIRSKCLVIYKLVDLLQEIVDLNDSPYEDEVVSDRLINLMTFLKEEISFHVKRIIV